MPLIYRTQFDGYNYNLKCLRQPWIDIFASNLQASLQTICKLYGWIRSISSIARLPSAVD